MVDQTDHLMQKRLKHNSACVSSPTTTLSMWALNLHRMMVQQPVSFMMR